MRNLHGFFGGPLQELNRVQGLRFRDIELNGSGVPKKGFIGVMMRKSSRK